MKKSIAIDMDDTVADTVSRHLLWYSNKFGKPLTKEDLHGKKIYDVVDRDQLPIVRGFPRQADFYKDLPLLDNAVEVIEELSRCYEIYFVSAAMEYPASFSNKYEWLRRHFPFISDMNYVFCGFKGILNCDYLIDDSSRHIDAFSGKGYLFDSAHNKLETGYDRVSSWLDVKEKLFDDRL